MRNSPYSACCRPRICKESKGPLLLLECEFVAYCTHQHHTRRIEELKYLAITMHSSGGLRRRCAPYSALDMNECLRAAWIFIFRNFCSKCVRTVGSSVPFEHTMVARTDAHSANSWKLIQIKMKHCVGISFERDMAVRTETLFCFVIFYVVPVPSHRPFQFHSTRWLTDWMWLMDRCIVELCNWIFCNKVFVCAISISIVCPRPMNLPRKSKKMKKWKRKEEWQPQQAADVPLHIDNRFPCSSANMYQFFKFCFVTVF